ncbi:TPA: ATP-binding cassette domain-containing protein, partial [Clostridioides difficile]|nr:ATP-binding cassette domain-containing protein [Clostridioides difficile]
MISLINISKKFKDKSIIDKFNLEISKGEFVAITGNSGSGKTTLLNIMGLLEKPNS